MKLLSKNSLPSNLHDRTFIKQLVTGQRLFQQGNSAKYFFIVQTGRFKLIRYLDTSNVINLAFAQPGASLGDNSLKKIAMELGFTPETLSRALLKLEKEGAIDRQQNQIILHNFSAA